MLTTFARGVYAAVLASLLLAGLLRLRQQHLQGQRQTGQHMPGWRARAGVALGLLLLAEVLLVLGTGSFMWQRLSHTPGDLGSRLQHWQRGLAMLHGHTGRLLGLGYGRLPAHYAALGPAGEFSGAVQWGRDAARQPYASLRGPATRQSLGGQFALAQRTREPPGGSHRVQLRLRTQAPVDLMLQWCERHLLYDGFCQTALLHADALEAPAQPAFPPAWQELSLQLQGDAPAPPKHWPRLSVFTVSVLNAGAVVDLARLQLTDATGRPLLDNSDFRQGLAHWQLTTQSYYLPWHIDSLVLELLLERGLPGLLLFAWLMAAALRSLCDASARHGTLAPFQAAALVAALCVGATGSVLDVPRVALLLYGLALCALLRQPAQGPAAAAAAK